MPLLPLAAPQPVPVFGGFDYVTVDAARRRVYAAHTGSSALAIVDAETGRVLGQVRLDGPVHGVAVDPETGHVFTGNGLARSVSEVDPVARRVLRSADVDGPVDAIAYDPDRHRLYADEDDGTHLFVVDTTHFASFGTVALPGRKPEYLAIDPATHRIWQNIASENEIVVIDPFKLAVVQTIPTRRLVGNHPLQFDPAFGLAIAGGTNGALAAYDRDGRERWHGAIQPHADQCDLDRARERLACAGGGELRLLQLSAYAPPRTLGAIAAPNAHTVGVDARTGDAWSFAADDGDDRVAPYRYRP